MPWRRIRVRDARARGERGRAGAVTEVPHVLQRAARGRAARSESDAAARLARARRDGGELDIFIERRAGRKDAAILGGDRIPHHIAETARGQDHLVGRIRLEERVGPEIHDARLVAVAAGQRRATERAHDKVRRRDAAGVDLVGERETDPRGERLAGFAVGGHGHVHERRVRIGRELVDDDGTAAVVVPHESDIPQRGGKVPVGVAEAGRRGRARDREWRRADVELYVLSRGAVVEKAVLERAVAALARGAILRPGADELDTRRVADVPDLRRIVGAEDAVAIHHHAVARRRVDRLQKDRVFWIADVVGGEAIVVGRGGNEQVADGKDRADAEAAELAGRDRVRLARAAIHEHRIRRVAGIDDVEAGARAGDVGITAALPADPPRRWSIVAARQARQADLTELARLRVGRIDLAPVPELQACAEALRVVRGHAERVARHRETVRLPHIADVIRARAVGGIAARGEGERRAARVRDVVEGEPARAVAAAAVVGENDREPAAMHHDEPVAPRRAVGVLEAADEVPLLRRLIGEVPKSRAVGEASGRESEKERD